LATKGTNHYSTSTVLLTMMSCCIRLDETTLDLNVGGRNQDVAHDKIIAA